MIPSPSWFPAALQDRAAWWTNFAVQFQSLHLSLGFVAADNTVVQDDNDVMQFIAETAVAVEAFTDAVRLYKLTVTQGNIGDPMPNIPAYTSPGSPTEVPAGIFERLDNLVKRIRVSPTYTAEAGALLGIIPASTERPPVNEMKPVVTVSEAISPYSFTMKATRFGLSAYKVQIQRSGSEAWVDNGFAQNNPYTVTVTPTTPGQSERILVRAVLMQDSQPVGIPSDPTYVTVNP